jgi:hypothetical protein
MEKKRRSRTRRDQPAANKPGQPYQKGSPRTRTNSSTAQPTSPDPPGRSPSRRRGASRASGVEASSSYSDPLPPRTSSDEYRSTHSSTISSSRSSSPSSPYYPSAGTSSSSPGPSNLSPLRASLPIPATIDHFQHMALTAQSTPDSLSPSSPGYHEFQSYDHEFPGDLMLQRPVSQTVPADGLRTATGQFNDAYGPNRSRWNEYDRQQGHMGSVYPRSQASYPPTTPDSPVPRLAQRPEQTTTTSSLSPMSHGLDTPAAEHPSGSFFYSGYEDRDAGTSLQSIYLLTDRSSNGDPSSSCYS